VRRRGGADIGLGLVLGGGLCLLTFATAGGSTSGTNLGPNTWAEIALVLLAAALGITAVRVSARGRAWGAVSLAVFAALAALTLLSISWSVQPDNSWLDTNLTLSYLAAFGGGIALARMAPERWGAIIGSIVLLAVVVSGYALLGKVFPTTVAPGQELLGARLSAPYGYWNAIGLIAALGLPGCVWLGARHGGRPFLRALAVPATGMLVATILLSYSRGALLAAVVGLAFWFALVPLRLRGALVLGLGVIAGAPVMLWALGVPGITSDGRSLPTRIAAGHSFGLVLLVMLLLSLGVGVAAGFAADRTRLSEFDRRRVGGALLALVACVPVVAVIALAASSRGFTGEISYGWSKLTSANVGSGGTSASRLLAEDNSHARYWSEGLKVGEHALLKGVGGLGFGTASLRYSSAHGSAANAHSFWIETFADFGLIGVALTLALLAAWGVAAARAVGARRPSSVWLRTRGRASPGEPVPERAAERAGLLTLLAVVVIFGVHSAIDWTWFIPGLAVPTLLCAGWLAGRGPLAEPVGRAARRPGDASLDPDESGKSPESPKPGGPRQRRAVRRWAAAGPRATVAALYRAFVAAPGRAAATAALTAIALLCAWTIWQPLRSADADAAALAELTANHPAAALAHARSAAALDPLSLQPRIYEWDIYSLVLNDPASARAALQTNVALQPANPATWLQLGRYDLTIGQPREAIAALKAGLYLFPQAQATPSLATLIAQAQSQLP
jgi:O-antigen ligase